MLYFIGSRLDSQEVPVFLRSSARAERSWTVRGLRGGLPEEWRRGSTVSRRWDKLAKEYGNDGDKGNKVYLDMRYTVRHGISVKCTA